MLIKESFFLFCRQFTQIPSMKFAKNQLIAFLLSACTIPAVAQVKFPVTDDELRNNLQKIVADFPNRLNGLKGDTIEINAQSIEFSSRLNFPMAAQNWITQYKSKNNIYSWEATILSTESFDEAVKKYKWLFNQLKVMTIKIEGGYSFTLSGKYDEPSEEREFSSSIFKMTPNAVNMPKLKIEASLRFVFPGEWIVSLLVYEREREDNERGDINGD